MISFNKDQIKALKANKNMLIRFDGDFSSIELFQDNVCTKIDFKSLIKSGSSYFSIYPDLGTTTFYALKQIKHGDCIYFDIEDHTTESMYKAGIQSAFIILCIQKYNKKGEYMRTEKYILNAQTELINSAYIKLNHNYHKQVA